MAEIEIYTTPLCPYCFSAKRLLKSRGVQFHEIDLWQEPDRRAEMIERSEGRKTVPQIFIDGRGIGGSDELHALASTAELDALLASAA